MVTNKINTVNVVNKYTFKIEFQKSSVNNLFLKHQNFSCKQFSKWKENRFKVLKYIFLSIFRGLLNEMLH